MPSSKASSQPRNQTCVSYVSCVGRQVLHHWHHLGSPFVHCHCQLLSCVWLLLIPWTAACQSSLSLTVSRSLLKFMSIESVMLSNHLILCHLLLLLPSILPRIRGFSNELALHIRLSKYWSFSISPSKEYSGLISFRTDWFHLLAVQGTLKSLLQFKSINSLVLSLFYGPTLTSVHDYWKNQSFDYTDFCMQSKSLFFKMLSSFVIVFLLPRSKSLLISWLQS